MDKNVEYLLVMIRAYQKAFEASESPSDWAVAGVLYASETQLESLSRKVENLETAMNVILQKGNETGLKHQEEIKNLKENYEKEIENLEEKISFLKTEASRNLL